MDISKWKCPKCKGQKFKGCKKCNRQKKMWECDSCGFICSEEYLEGKPLPSEMKNFLCPQCGAGVAGIIPCKTCSGDNAYRCENCGYRGKVANFKPFEYKPKKKKKGCCGK